MINMESIMGVLLALMGNILTAVSQVLLKQSSQRQYTSRIYEYLNLRVIYAYGILFCTTMLSAIALRWIPLSLCAALGASAQIFVPLMSRFILHEPINRKKAFGMVVIVIGLLVYSI